MSDDSDLKATLVEELTERASVAALLGDSSLEEEIDVGEVGGAVGREFGARLGRELGGAIVREVQAAIANEGEDGTSRGDIFTVIDASIRRAISDVLRDFGGTNALESLLSDGVEESIGDEDASAEGEDGNVVEASPEDLEDLRRETLEDFLDMMSYRELQSVAKDVGVKANLGQEEMTERIIDQVSGDEEE